MRVDLFRVSVVDGGGDLFRRAMSREERGEAVRLAISERPSGVYWGKTFQLFNVEREHDVMWGRIATPTELDRSVIDETTGNLVDEKLESTDWTSFVYLTLDQVIGVARDTTFFTGSVQGMARLLEHVLNGSTREDDYQFRVMPLSQNQSFWNIVESARAINSLRFEFIPPNLFGGAGKLEAALRTLRTNEGARRVGYDLKNSDNGLTINRDDPEISEHVDYVSLGGGVWKLIYTDGNGNRGQRARSDSDAVSAPIELEVKEFGDSTVRSKLLRLVRGLLERLR